MKLFDEVALEDLGLAGLDQRRGDHDGEVEERSPASSDGPPKRAVLVSAKIII